MNNQEYKTIESDFPKNHSIAFITSTLVGAEFPLHLIRSINDHLEENPYDEICIYNMNRELPIATTKFAVYNTIDISNYRGFVIATDIPSWQTGMSSVYGTKMVYAYDVNKFEAQKPFINKINESSVKIFTRTEKHSEKLKVLGYNNVIPLTMEDPNIAQLIGWINNGEKEYASCGSVKQG